MDRQEEVLRKTMVLQGQSLFMRGLSGGSSGNMSVRLDCGGFLATPTGYSLGALEPDLLSELDSNGRHLSGPAPTKEVFMHLACYKANDTCNAVVHLHSPFAVALSCINGLDPDNCLPLFTPYAVMRIGMLPLAPYCKPGSPEIGHQLDRHMPGRTAVLLANHGPVVCGRNLEDAVCNSEEVEAAARLYFLLHGCSARALSPDQVQALMPRPVYE